MTEAIFGLVGVLIGSGISWLQAYWVSRRDETKSAKYLAIRVVCILDKYVEDCVDVVKDDGHSEGQRDSEGCLRPQVKSPGAPIFPADIDWKSIDQDLMYKLLSLPSEVEAADRMIRFISEIAVPPDYDEWFDERKFYYSKFGLAAYELSGELSDKYNIKKKIYDDWDPSYDLQQELGAVIERREKRLMRQRNFVKQVLEGR